MNFGVIGIGIAIDSLTETDTRLTRRQPQDVEPRTIRLGRSLGRVKTGAIRVKGPAAHDPAIIGDATGPVLHIDGNAHVNGSQGGGAGANLVADLGIIGGTRLVVILQDAPAHVVPGGIRGIPTRQHTVEGAALTGVDHGQHQLGGNNDRSRRNLIVVSADNVVKTQQHLAFIGDTTIGPINQQAISRGATRLGLAGIRLSEGNITLGIIHAVAVIEAILELDVAQQAKANDLAGTADTTQAIVEGHGGSAAHGGNIANRSLERHILDQGLHGCRGGQVVQLDDQGIHAHPAGQNADGVFTISHVGAGNTDLPGAGTRVFNRQHITGGRILG